MSEGRECQQPAIWSESEFPRRPAAAPASEPAPKPPARFQPVNRQQMVWRAVDVEQLLETNHRARAIWEMTGRLDLRLYTAQVRAVEGEAGRPPIDPRVLISLWVYAYSEQVGSAREVARRCTYHPAYLWLTGCEEINHHTLSDFRVQHQQALDGLFAQLLAILSQEGLMGLEQVAHDGTKVKAAASRQSFHREPSLRTHLAAAQERVRAMGDPRQPEGAAQRQRTARQRAAQERAAREKVERLQQALAELQQVQAAPEGRAEPGERRASETDPEARPMKQSDGGIAPSHNVQISTDTAHSIIVAASVTQEPTDQKQLLPAMAEIERQNGRLPDPILVDEGYTTRENIVAAAEHGWEMIGDTMQRDQGAVLRQFPRRGLEPAFYPQNFTYDAAHDTYTCPAGKELAHRATRPRAGVELQVYQARAADCRQCPSRGGCKPGKQGRMLVRTEPYPQVTAYLAKMQTPEAQAAYRRRAPVAAFSNLWIKAKLGLRQFCVRGLRKARCEVLWACLTYNIQQWFRLRWKPRLSPVAA